MIGQTLRHYRITEKIGAGGMGIVYRATDTKLNRDVAIKVLPDAFAETPQRRARFEREAQLLAALNHPNIAAIYGLERENGVDYLVLEYVPGESLAEKLARGPLPVEEAIELAIQIADALDAAHESGVIHRDLKPANIMVTADGQVKVLDFGLAKAFAEDPTGENLSDSPTLSAMATREGMILGTAAYMSPEQARGRPVDKRTDIFAFGSVLYEMLTGRRAFQGEDVSDTLAAVIRADVDWNPLPRDVESRIQRVLEGCLRKDRKERRRDVGDVRVDLQEVLAHPESARAQASAAHPPSAASGPIFWWALASSFIAAALGVTLMWSARPDVAANPRMRFQMIVPPDHSLTNSNNSGVAISSDGKRVAYVAGQQIYVREMDELEARAVQGTERGRTPFFSPDGAWLGFWATEDGKLKKVRLDGGAPVSLCDANRPFGATWGDDGHITFGQAFHSISQVSDSGGTPRVLVKLDEAKQEIAYRPQMLPGGTAVLYTLATTPRPNWEDAQIVVQTLGDGARRILVEGGFSARYLSSGHLIYARADTVMATSFDSKRLALTGDAVPVAEGVRSLSSHRPQDQFDVSRSGTVAYIPMGAATSLQLNWVDREGRATPMSNKTGAYLRPRFSPDGGRLALAIGELGGSNKDIWIYDIERDTFSRLTTEGDNLHARWSPDGNWVAFRSERDGEADIYKRRVDFSTPTERVLSKAGHQDPQSWSPDGKHLLFLETVPSSRGESRNLWWVDLEGQGEPQPFVQSPFREEEGVFSPDGRWVAYHSNESGRSEVYVQPFPGPGQRWQISTDGGYGAAWSPDGRELFYIYFRKIMAVDVRTEPTFNAGTPYVLFEGSHVLRSGPDYDMAPDGERFVMLFRDEVENPLAGREINIDTNVLAGLDRLGPSE